MDFSSYMIETYLIARESPDPSTQNGALLIDQNGEILGGGCNDFPGGVNSKHWYGEKEAKYARVVHAETSAVLDAAIRGNSTLGSILVCPWAACSNCAKHIARAGVRALVRHPWEDQITSDSWKVDCDLGDEIMAEAGIEIIEIAPVAAGFSIRRNGELWAP